MSASTPAHINPSQTPLFRKGMGESRQGRHWSMGEGGRGRERGMGFFEQVAMPPAQEFRSFISAKQRLLITQSNLTGHGWSRTDPTHLLGLTLAGLPHPVKWLNPIYQELHTSSLNTRLYLQIGITAPPHLHPYPPKSARFTPVARTFPRILEDTLITHRVRLVSAHFNLPTHARVFSSFPQSSCTTLFLSFM